MLKYGDLLCEPNQLGVVEGLPVLVAAATNSEVLIQESGPSPEPTMIFMHETIAIMKAERAEKLEKLRGVIGPESHVVPLMKRPGSFWDHVTVGRASTADIVFDDPAVSNVHAHFVVDPEDSCVCLQDVGSSNGTFVNREPLQPHVPTYLASGDCLRFGQSIFYFVTNQALRDLILGLSDDGLHPIPTPAEEKE